MWMLICIPFFLCCLEEYHIDTFYLPVINGVNEGNLIVSLVLILSGFVGQDYWDNKIGSYNYGQVLVYTIFIVSIIFWIIR